MNQPTSLTIGQGPKASGQTHEKETPSSKAFSFGEFYLGAVLHPGRTFDRLVRDPRRVRFGFLAVCIPAVLYTVFYILATMAGGAPSSFKPWLAIPTEVYFAYDRFLLAPTLLICWIAAAGVAQLLSRLFAGKGSFEDNLSVLGFGISLAIWPTQIHDLIDAILGALGVISMPAYEIALNTPTFWRGLYWVLMALELIGFLVYFSRGIAAAQRLRRGPAAFVGVAAFVVYQLLFLVFIR